MSDKFCDVVLLPFPFTDQATSKKRPVVIFVPRGDADDGPGDPGVLDGIADFLGACGARALGAPSAPVAEEGLL
jgi:hypothetical protein